MNAASAVVAHSGDVLDNVLRGVAVNGHDDNDDDEVGRSASFRGLYA